MRFREAGIVDRADTNSKIRAQGSVHYIRIHALAPSNRPVQVTGNPALFWRETYPKLQTAAPAQISQARPAVNGYGKHHLPVFSQLRKHENKTSGENRTNDDNPIHKN
jgi:hypothetical protein